MQDGNPFTTALQPGYHLALIGFPTGEPEAATET
jgi:hypothetical protein